MQIDKSEGFFEAAQEIYRREAPELVKKHPPGLTRADEVTGRSYGIHETSFFGEVTVRKYPWEAEYDAESYTRLLSTYSDHINLNDASRERLLNSISRLIDTEFGGRVIKGYLSVLYVAHARAGSP